MGTVKLTKTGLTEPQDIAIRSSQRPRHNGRQFRVFARNLTMPSGSAGTLLLDEIADQGIRQAPGDPFR